MRKHSGLVLGAILGAAGCFMTWSTVSAGIFSKSINGMDTGDGPILLVGFLVIGVISLIAWLSETESPALAVFAILAGLGLAIGGFMDLTEMAEKANLAKDADFKISVSTGPGLWMVIGGAITMLVSGISDLVRDSKKPAPAATPAPAAPVPAATPPGTLTCQSCGRQTLASARFCAHCAAELPRQDLTLDCPSCRKAVTIGSSFCPHCAGKMPGLGI